MKLIKLFFLFISINLFAQEVPRIKLQDSTFLALKQLEVKTEVVGNIATTTYNMTFYNGTDRVLEGQLAFPLGQGQSVTNFAMDINGKLRDAVIVEKELGRVAYESTIRQTIDPGLLEITKGNNYKARVYPIPAKGYKLLSITFEQEMTASNGKHLYQIPLHFSDPLDFNLDVVVSNVNQEPRIIGDNLYKLKFKEVEGVLKASSKQTKAIVNTAVVLEFPIGSKESVTTYNKYFNVYKSFNPKNRIKEKPKNITMYWDASYSMKFRDLESEIKLLDTYFKYLKRVSVNLVVFSNVTQKPKQFNITNGNWKLLKKEIESVVYDGGTSCLDIKSTAKDEMLFFSDGMVNLGELQNKFSGRIYTINSVKSANHELLERIANQNKGKYINLNFIKPDVALHAIKTESFKFLGIDKNKSVSEVYPLPNTTVNSDFSVSGKFDSNTEVKLNFGYNGQVTEHLKVNLIKSSFNGLVKRLWAKKKLQALNIDKENNKDDIVKLAKKHHLISEFTSLIILDRIEDYVRYKIEPPLELKTEYKALMANNSQAEAERQEEIQDRKEDLIKDYQDLMEWYSTKYPIVTKIKKPKSLNTVTVRTESTTVNEPSIPEPEVMPVRNALPETELDTNSRIISGVITDENGLPLPGTSIFVKGTSRGTTTDFDGNFSINANVGDRIAISYVGYVNKEFIVGNNSNVNSTLEPDNNLDEVVITAYTSVTRKSVTSSVQVVKSESVTDAVQTLSGRVVGVNIEDDSGQPGGSPQIIIRGQSTIGNNTPLYVIDGVIVSDTEFKKIDTDSIDSLTVLKDASTSALFGSRASNEVIIIRTKAGLKNRPEEIEELDNKIREDINFKPWSAENDYIKLLMAQTSIEDAYKTYLSLRGKYRNTPSFFMDVADFFDSKQEAKLAIKVLSNLVEIDLDNHEVMRALAYKLEYFKQDQLALHVYKEILKLRPEEPQSTRDLSLAFENVGQYQKAFDLLYTLIDGQLVEKDLDERFYGIEHLAFIEAGHLIQKYKGQIQLTEVQKKRIQPIKLDLRVVADWNHNDTDLDLWVETPEEVSISYKKTISDFGDHLSEDMTEGYGPEEFMIKKGLKGTYEIELDYFADDVQKISGPTTLKITIFKNYGSKDETKEVRVFRLDAEKDLLEIGSIQF